MSAIGVGNLPAPIPNGNPSIHDLVTEDVLQRKAFGLNKYGSLLQAGNQRSGLQDLYEELLDAACYIRKVIEEEKLTERVDAIQVQPF